MQLHLFLIAGLWAGFCLANPTETEFETDAEVDQPLPVDRRADCGSAGCCQSAYSSSEEKYICVKCCKLEVGKSISHSRCSTGRCPCFIYGSWMCVKCENIKRFNCVKTEEASDN